MGETDSDFDILLDRRNTDSLKWEKYRRRDILPMWVADMDFRCPQCVIEAIKKRVEHGIFGYTVRPEKLNSVVQQWVMQKHAWPIREDWIVWLPGLVCALNAACRGLVESDRQYATFTPIYPPFLTAANYSDRQILRCPLQHKNGRFSFDLNKFNEISGDKTAMLLFSNPHNPTGRVWNRQELSDLAEICLKKNIIICSDEIHCDLVLDTFSKHIPTATLSDAAAQNSVTLMSASKTFNLAGLNCAFAIIPNPHIRQRFRKACFGIVPHINALGYIATMAAFSDTSGWHTKLLNYLRTNRDILYQNINSFSGLTMTMPEATYLAWIDTRSFNFDSPAAFFENAGVGVSDGLEFDGPGFVRLNFACPRELLIEAIKRIGTAVEKYRQGQG